LWRSSSWHWGGAGPFPRRGPVFSPPQLAFAAITALALYGLFVALQTGRHRDYFLPVTADGEVIDADYHATPPSTRAALISLALLLVALVAAVGHAKLVSPTIERAVVAAGFPVSVVGVIIAMLILLPETLAAWRAARRGRMQISLNLAFGSAMASIGLTIPTIAVASIWLPGALHLGLDAIHIVLLMLTFIVTVLTVVPGRATLLQAGVHLALLAAYLFLAISP
jgi:Ca2+:H+ antiporter